MKNKEEKKFKGPLNVPIKVSIAVSSKITNSIDLQSEEHFQPYIMAKYNKAIEDKLPMLFEHFKVEDESDYKSLCIELAKFAIKGFKLQLQRKSLSQGDHGTVESKIKGAGGRPLLWTTEKLVQLANLVESQKGKDSNLGATDKEILRRNEILKVFPVPTRKESVDTWIETLESRLSEGRRLIKIEKETEEWAQAFIVFVDGEMKTKS